MPRPRQLPPSTRLLRILLNRLIFSPTHQKPHHPQSHPPHAFNLPTRHLPHHLLRHRPQSLLIHTNPVSSELPFRRANGPGLFTSQGPKLFFAPFASLRLKAFL